MQNCLGIYVEKKLIKYAKVAKERDNVKVEAFGIKFSDNLNETLKQIVNETYSFKTPISINISDDKYTYANLFNLLNKKYFAKAIETEFESFCNDEGKNKNALEMRSLQVENLEDKDKTTILYSYCNKSNIVTKAQLLEGYRTEGMYPLPIIIKNLGKFTNSQNSIIVNIENKTSITTIVNGKIYKVDSIELGMEEILNSINLKENSYQKSYEICKNSTIYTLGSGNLQTEENDYMDDIMPTLYSIIQEVKEAIGRNLVDIQNIYITGLATVINNLDLYFQENFPNKNCEILTPYFAQKSNLKLNIRDYIEVNSAISLALQGLGEGEQGVNFKKKTGFEGVSKILSIDIGSPKADSDKSKINIKEKLKIDFSGSLGKLEKNALKGAVIALCIIIIYVVGEKWLLSSINSKKNEITDVQNDTNSKISIITNYNRLVTSRSEEYKKLVNQINTSNEELTKIYASKNAIPNFLTQIMFNMPKDVQLISIKNTTGKTVEIVAQAEKYEQLGYLKATLKNSGILSDITSTSGTKQSGIIEVTITGNLPY